MEETTYSSIRVPLASSRATTRGWGVCITNCRILVSLKLYGNEICSLVRSSIYVWDSKSGLSSAGLAHSLKVSRVMWLASRISQEQGQLRLALFPSPKNPEQLTIIKRWYNEVITGPSPWFGIRSTSDLDPVPPSLPLLYKSAFPPLLDPPTFSQHPATLSWNLSPRRFSRNTSYQKVSLLPQ